MRASGVHAEPFRPMALMALNKVQHRAHIRVICIDGQIELDRRVRHRRQAVRQRSNQEPVARLERAVHWTSGEPTPVRVRRMLGRVDGRAADRSGASPRRKRNRRSRRERFGRRGLAACVAIGGSTEAERFFTYSIASARTKLYITNSYFVPDRDIRGLIAAAARRGVDTRYSRSAARPTSKAHGTPDGRVMRSYWAPAFNLRIQAGDDARQDPDGRRPVGGRRQYECRQSIAVAQRRDGSR